MSIYNVDAMLQVQLASLQAQNELLVTCALLAVLCTGLAVFIATRWWDEKCLTTQRKHLVDEIVAAISLPAVLASAAPMPSLSTPDVPNVSRTEGLDEVPTPAAMDEDDLDHDRVVSESLGPERQLPPRPLATEEELDLSRGQTPD